MVTRTQRVIVAYDGSVDSDRGLEWAIDYARLRSAPLDVVSASGDLEYLPERTSAEAVDLVEGWGQRAAARLKEAGLTDWSTSTTKGKIVPELIEASRDAALLVVGAQGHGLIGGMVLGSVSQHLTRHAHCPVAVVRGTRAVSSTRVLVGVDGSDASQKAVGFAFEYAAAAGGSVVLVHGRGMSAVNGPWDVDVAPDVVEDVEAGKRLLAEAVAGCRTEHPDVPYELLALPVPAVRALADASRNASLIVVGTRGRGGFMGLLLGSVSATVLQHAECPVVVVR